MKYGKREYRLPKTENRQETGKAESGQVSWVLGLFLILFLAILLYMQLQLAMYKASARYLEDALALSNLASAVIDIREYGSTHKVHITDQEQAYAGYCSAVRENLGLNENYEAVGHKLISGKVEIRNYIIYNVTGTKVQVWERNGDGRILEWEGTLGEVRTPGGQTIENTGVYSEITYPVEGFLGITVTAEKSKLVDVVSEYMGEETNEKRKMSQAWKNRIWNGSILAAFVAAMAVFVFAADRKESAYGIRKRTGMRGNGGNSQGRKNLRGKCRAVYDSHGNRQKNCAGDCTEKHRGGKRKNSGIWSGTGDGTDYRHAAGTVGDHRTDAGTCYSRIPRRRSVPGSGRCPACRRQDPYLLCGTGGRGTKRETVVGKCVCPTGV